ncbi:hypothetical protein AB4212_25980, partial [Streptomyces sp. 2MCAF27]
MRHRQTAVSVERPVRDIRDLRERGRAAGRSAGAAGTNATRAGRATARVGDWCRLSSTPTEPNDGVQSSV